MRRIHCIFAGVALAAWSVLAQERSDWQPLPAVPPPPPEMAPLNKGLSSGVTVIKTQEGDTIEEHRINGHLYKLKVTPAHGIPYVLVDVDGGGNFTGTTVSSDAGDQKVPQWVIGTS